MHSTAPTGRGEAAPVQESFTSVSLCPPLVSFCVDGRSSSWPVLRETDHVAVHVLDVAQADLARTFPAGDHVIVLAEPVEIECADGSPLLYHNGQYVGLA